METRSPADFEEAARTHGQGDASLFGELWLFLRDNKKWWLLPILGVLLLFGVLVLLSGSAAAPFIYTLF
jgi:hypothetical protein